MSDTIDTRFAALAASIRAGGDRGNRAMDDLVRSERSHLARSLWQKFPQLRDDIDDIALEAFEILWTRASNCGCFRDGGTYSEFRALLQKQASFLALSRLRQASERKAKAEMFSADALNELTMERWEIADTRNYEIEMIANIDAQRLTDRVSQAELKLTDRQRVIAQLMLTLPDGDVNKAICEELHISEGAAREAKRAVRQRLRQLVPI